MRAPRSPALALLPLVASLVLLLEATTTTGAAEINHSADQTTTNIQTFLTLPIQNRKLSPLGDSRSSSSSADEEGRRLATTAATMGARQQLDALYQDYGEHYVDLWCGTPPQRQTLLVVTGISPGASGFPCTDCGDDCQGAHVDRLFQQAESSTFRTLTCQECLNGNCITGGDTCQVGMSYPEGSSWRGYEVQDTCYMGGPHDKPLLLPMKKKNKLANKKKMDDIDPNHASLFAFDFIFGCQTQITGSFLWHLADGILSMDNTPGSYWYQMYSAGKIPERKFTMCYRKAPSAPSTKGNEAGSITLGGVDTRLHKSDMVMSVLDATSPSYKVKLRYIHLRAGGGGDSARSTNKAVPVKTLALSPDAYNDDHPFLLDSGYTLTVLSKEIMGPLYDAWKELTGDTYTNFPKSMSETERDALPTLLLQLVGDEEYNAAVQAKNGGTREIGGGRGWTVGLTGDLDPDHPLDVLVAVPPSHYMERVEGDGSTSTRFKAGFVEASSREQGKNVLGANVMRGHNILFDLEDDRLGWAESSCNYTDLVDEYFDGAFGDIDHDDDDDTVESSGDGLTPPAIGASTTTAATSDRVGICDSGVCGGMIIFLVLAGILVAVIVQVQKHKHNRSGQINYQDVPTEFELTDRDVGNYSYRPPPTAA